MADKKPDTKPPETPKEKTFLDKANDLLDIDVFEALHEVVTGKFLEKAKTVVTETTETNSNANSDSGRNGGDVSGSESAAKGSGQPVTINNIFQSVKPKRKSKSIAPDENPKGKADGNKEPDKENG